jgi:hypothetical protein
MASQFSAVRTSSLSVADMLDRHHQLMIQNCTTIVRHIHLTLKRLLCIISQSLKFRMKFFSHQHQEEHMRSVYVPLLKDFRTNITSQRKIGTIILKSKFKNQNTKRQRINLSVNAGHVRGGHSFF